MPRAMEAGPWIRDNREDRAEEGGGSLSGRLQTDKKFLSRWVCLNSLEVCKSRCCCCSLMFDSLWPRGLHYARLPCLSPTSCSLLKLMSIKSMMPSNHLFLCCPLLLLPSVLSSIRVFSSESVLCIRWPKYWSFSFSISPSNEYSGLISFRMQYLISLKSKRLSRVSSNSKVQKHQFFGAQLSLWSNSHTHTWLLEKP